VLKDLAAMPGNVTAVIFTTNWAALKPLEETLPNGNYVLADAIVGGSISGNRLTATIKPLLPLGAVHPTAEARTETIVRVFSEIGLSPGHEDDILHWHWLQYALNAAMWPALVEAGTSLAVVKDREIFQRMLAAVREALDLCALRGVTVGEYPESRMFLNGGSGVASRVKTWAMREAYGLAVVHSEYHRRCMQHGLKDQREIATAYNAVLATGHDLGCQMPVFDSFKDTIARFQQA
jgi:ketopantoate reductase